MALRIRAALAAMLPSREDGRHVHFHTGPQAQPVPCFEALCASPVDEPTRPSLVERGVGHHAVAIDVEHGGWGAENSLHPLTAPLEREPIARAVNRSG